MLKIVAKLGASRPCPMVIGHKLCDGLRWAPQLGSVVRPVINVLLSKVLTSAWDNEKKENKFLCVRCSSVESFLSAWARWRRRKGKENKEKRLERLGSLRVRGGWRRDKNKRGRKATRRRFRGRRMWTPCGLSSLTRLPDLLQIQIRIMRNPGLCSTLFARPWSNAQMSRSTYST